ncbi:MAG: hypothetical protein HZA62_02150 [Rhodocyclales bacterium]|nr:hypothetical protein [Rhodocyclales bacterium]
MLRMESRRFAARCEAQISSIERADNLREIARLSASLYLPTVLSADDPARDAVRLLQTRAGDRARELILEQIQAYVRAEDSHREKLKRAMLDAWTNLTGPLGYLRSWAQGRLLAAEQRAE